MPHILICACTATLASALRCHNQTNLQQITHSFCVMYSFFQHQVRKNYRCSPAGSRSSGRWVFHPVLCSTRCASLIQPQYWLYVLESGLRSNLLCSNSMGWRQKLNILIWVATLKGRSSPGHITSSLFWLTHQHYHDAEREKLCPVSRQVWAHNL